MEPWSHGSTIFWDLACHFQNCKLEVCTTKNLKYTEIFLSPSCSKPFRQACIVVWNFKYVYCLHKYLYHMCLVWRDLYATRHSGLIHNLLLPRSTKQALQDLNNLYEYNRAKVKWKRIISWVIRFFIIPKPCRFFPTLTSCPSTEWLKISSRKIL